MDLYTLGEVAYKNGCEKGYEDAKMKYGFGAEMCEVTRESLCKRKAIYWLYVNSRGELHIERRPVAYINKNYVYYVAGKGQRLHEVDVRGVLESPGSRIDKNIANARPMDYGVLNSYYWNVPQHYIEELREYREVQKKKVSAASRISDAEKSVEYAEKQLVLAKERLNRVLSEEGIN